MFQNLDFEKEMCFFLLKMNLFLVDSRILQEILRGYALIFTDDILTRSIFELLLYFIKFLNVTGTLHYLKKKKKVD